MRNARHLATLVGMYSSTTTDTVIREWTMHDTAEREITAACRHCQGLSQGKAERCHFCGRWLLKVAELVR